MGLNDIVSGVEAEARKLLSGFTPPHIRAAGRIADRFEDLAATIAHAAAPLLPGSTVIGEAITGIKAFQDRIVAELYTAAGGTAQAPTTPPAPVDAAPVAPQPETPAQPAPDPIPAQPTPTDPADTDQAGADSPAGASLAGADSPAGASLADTDPGAVRSAMHG